MEFEIGFRLVGCGLMRSDNFTKIWVREIEKLNDHLPRNYKTLEFLLESKDPYVLTMDGDRIVFKREELQSLAKIVPKKYHGKLQLPIVFIRRIDMGEGVFSISGGKIEKGIVMKLLGLIDNPFSEDESAFLPYIYRYQVLEIRRKIRSLTTIGFATTKLNFKNADFGDKLD
ncbi:MAG: DUF61 family protein [Candidatus Freyarchaeum deiterrae]